MLTPWVIWYETCPLSTAHAPKAVSRATTANMTRRARGLTPDPPLGGAGAGPDGSPSRRQHHTTVMAPLVGPTYPPVSAVQVEVWTAMVVHVKAPKPLDAPVPPLIVSSGVLPTE